MLTSFEEKVAAIAHRYKNFRGSQYNHKAIALSILRKREQSISKAKLKKITSKVKDTVNLLKERGKLSPSFPIRAPTLRNASTKDVEDYSYIVNRVLKRGHRYLRLWKLKFIPRQDAFRIGQYGLVRGLETFDERKSPDIENHLAAWVASMINREIKKLRGKRGTVPLEDAAKDKEKITRELAWTSAPDPQILDEKIEQLHQLYLQGKATKAQLLISVLRGFGHNSTEIGTHFGVSGESILQIEKAANKNLNKAVQVEKLAA